MVEPLPVIKGGGEPWLWPDGVPVRVDNPKSVTIRADDLRWALGLVSLYADARQSATPQAERLRAVLEAQRGN